MPAVRDLGVWMALRAGHERRVRNRVLVGWVDRLASVVVERQAVDVGHAAVGLQKLSRLGLFLALLRRLGGAGRQRGDEKSRDNAEKRRPSVAGGKGERTWSSTAGRGAGRYVSSAGRCICHLSRP
jgi:hypothetical protein